MVCTCDPSCERERGMGKRYGLIFDGCNTCFVRVQRCPVCLVRLLRVRCALRVGAPALWAAALGSFHMRYTQTRKDGHQSGAC